MPFCTECGRAVEPGRYLCPACGTRIEESPLSPDRATGPARGRRTEPLAVLLLVFVTCGIYHIFWCAKRAQEINAFLSRGVISPTTAALSACCLPVSAYTLYVFGQSLPDMQRVVGLEQKDRSILLMILGIFLPMVAAMIMQQELNRVWDKAR